MPVTISGDAPNFTSASATTITGVTTLNGSSGVLATQNGMTGIAKAWVNFVGSSGSINGSFNISSITIVSAGIYTVNLTTAMPNTNYCIQVTNAQNSTSNLSSNLGGQSATTTSFKIVHYENDAQVHPFSGSSIYATVFSS